MRNLFAAILFTSVFGTYGVANAADECGPGCHSTVNGACAVDGWETGSVRWNECPAGADLADRTGKRSAFDSSPVSAFAATDRGGLYLWPKVTTAGSTAPSRFAVKASLISSSE